MCNAYAVSNADSDDDIPLTLQPSTTEMAQSMTKLLPIVTGLVADRPKPTCSDTDNFFHLLLSARCKSTHRKEEFYMQLYNGISTSH